MVPRIQKLRIQKQENIKAQMHLKTHEAPPCSPSTPENDHYRQKRHFYGNHLISIQVMSNIVQLSVATASMANQDNEQAIKSEVQGNFYHVCDNRNTIKAQSQVENSFSTYNIIDKMKVSPSFFIFMTLMLLLHHLVAALNWQGTGNMSNDNLTVIWGYINANFKINVDANTIQEFNTGLSDHLNGQWNPTWNVVTVKIPTGETYNDVILYGYTFRNHWLWYNGYTDASISEQSFSFVIWKDYNCKGWKTIGKNAAQSEKSGFSMEQEGFIVNLINSIGQGSLLNDPWTLAKSFVDAMQGSPNFAVRNDHAYSVVLSQQYVNVEECVWSAVTSITALDFIWLVKPEITVP